MASSGSFNTSAYSSRYLTFSWSLSSQSTSGNYSVISWKLVGAGGTTTSYFVSGNFKVVIDGDTCYSSSTRINLYNGTTVASGTKTIYHSSDGTKTFSASAQAGIYTVAVNCTGSGSWTLTTIPRYLTINSFSIQSMTETSAVVYWAVSNARDQTYYSLNGGDYVGSATYGETVASDSKSGTFNIPDLTANTTYTLKIKIRRTDSQQWTESSTISFTTYDYPKPSSINNFTIGDGATVNLYNPLNRECTLDLISYNDGSNIGTFSGTYEGIVNAEFATDEAIASQYASIPNSQVGVYYAKVTYGDITKSLDSGEYKVKGTEVPVFTNFTYQDTNSDVTAITGDDQIIIKGLSTLRAVVSSDNKMVAQNSSTGSKYVATIDTSTSSASYNEDEDVVIDIGAVNSSGTKRLTVTAYDSRSLTTSAYQDISIYDYSKPVINVSLSRLNNFETETTLSVNGTYTVLNINDSAINTINSVQYRYRETDGEWSEWEELTYEISNSTFTCNDLVLSLDNTSSFEFEIEVTDNFGSNTTTANVDVGEAIFFISTNKKTCYINGQEILMYDVVDEWDE